jgi:carbamoyl-phosphate synthase large subunit
VRPFDKYEVGKLFIRYSYDLITDISEFEKLSLYAEL